MCVAVHTRFERSDGLPDWNPMCLVCTPMAHHVTKVLLDMPYDEIGAFRLYFLERIPREIWDLVRSIRHSLLHREPFCSAPDRCLIVEVPITLLARTKGHSKITIWDSFCAAGWLWKLHLEARRDLGRFRLAGRAS